MTVAKKQCGAKLTSRDGFCKNPAGLGTDHAGYGKCKHHFGCTESGMSGAVKEAAEELRQQLGAPITIDPHELLIQEVYRCAGHVAWLEIKVRELEDDQLTEVNIGGKTQNFWIRWYVEERARAITAAAVAIKAGVAERRVALAEEQGQLLAAVIRAVLAGLKLSPEQERAAPEVVRAALTLVPNAA